MAARENQGYLIAVIILVLLTLVLALSAFLGISKASEHADARKADAKKLYFAEKLGEANDVKSNIYVTLIGNQGPSIAELRTQRDRLQSLATDRQLASDEQQQLQLIIQKVDEVVKQFDNDMLDSVTVAEGEPAPTPTYREKLQNLTSLVAVKNKDISIQVNQTRQSEKEATDRITRMSSDLKTSQEAQNKALADLKSEKERSLTNQQKLKSEVGAANIQLESEKKKYQNFQQTTTATISGLKVDVQGFEVKNEALKNTINRLTRVVYDRPDGQVIKVASGLHSVFINLGREDGLTNNRTFAIYDQSVTNFEADNHKATIEVTDVTAYGAQARITEEDPTNPILAGDYVLTATWDPGFAVEFALAGVFDLDGDGYDDTAKLSRMIERNGGKVVVQHDAEGNIQGTMNPKIRYLVIGSNPKLGHEGYGSIVSSIRTLEEQAEKNTIQVIDLQKLLSRMGVRAKPKMLKIDQPSGGFEDRSSSDTLKSNDQ